MDLLQQSIRSYSKMLDIEYDLILGKRFKQMQYILTFKEINFYHLAGLHYLTDVTLNAGDREIFFNDIENYVTFNMIHNSKHYNKKGIENRLNNIIQFENIIDNDEIICRFFKRRSNTNIEADFVMKVSDSYIFWRIEQDNILYCMSTFKNETDKYILGQERLTILKRTKRNKLTGEIISEYINPHYNNT